MDINKILSKQWVKELKKRNYEFYGDKNFKHKYQNIRDFKKNSLMPRRKFMIVNTFKKMKESNNPTLKLKKLQKE